MTKFLKTLLVIGIICVAVGYGANAAGIQIPGVEEIKEKIMNHEWDFSLDDFELDIDPFYELEEPDYFNKDEKIYENEDSVKEAFGMNEFQKVHVKGAGIAIKFVAYSGSESNIGDGKSIVIHATKSGKYQAYVKENALYIIVNGKSQKELGEGLVEIMVPQEAYDTAQLSITVEASAAAIELGEMQAENVNVELSAGTINWSGLTANELQIAMAAGTVNGGKTIILNETDIDMKAGAVALEGVLGKDVDINVAAGKITLKLAHSMADYNYDLSCAGGSIKLGEERVEGIVKGREMDHQAEYDMDIECSVGTVEVSFITS
jgi:hypothetical protein